MVDAEETYMGRCLPKRPFSLLLGFIKHVKRLRADVILAMPTPDLPEKHLLCLRKLLAIHAPNV